MARRQEVWYRRQDLGESVKAHEIFIIYHSLGVDRSPARLEEELAKSEKPRSIKLLRQLQARFKWISRARAYDEYLVKLQFKAIENSVKDEGVKWAERIKEYREESYTKSIELIAKADEMMAWPIATTEVDKIEQIEVNGQTVEVTTHVTMKPVKWTRRDVIYFHEYADKLRRLALEVPTERKLFNFEFSDNDAEARLQKAQGVFQHLSNQIDKWLAADPSLSREIAIEVYREQVAEDWKISPDLLIFEQESEFDGLSISDFEN